MTLFRMLRIIEYVGPQEWVNDAINHRSVKGAKILSEGIIREGILGETWESFDTQHLTALRSRAALMVSGASTAINREEFAGFTLAQIEVITKRELRIAQQILNLPLIGDAS